MVAIEGGDAGQRAAARAPCAAAGTAARIRPVQNGDAASMNADRDFLFAHRYLLSPAVTPQRFTVDGLRAIVADSIDLLASPAGMMLKPLLPRDPTGELMAMVSGLNAGAQPNAGQVVGLARWRAGHACSDPDRRARFRYRRPGKGHRADPQPVCRSCTGRHGACSYPAPAVRGQCPGQSIKHPVTRLGHQRPGHRCRAVLRLIARRA